MIWLKIDLSCGNDKPKGFIGLDKLETGDADIVCDTEGQYLLFKDENVELIRRSHVIEHISNREVLFEES
ncbi:MAG: SAM-dependent methyltransferase [Candidatus Methanohalarchaeum thermophilum]|uniref:SAM-dependent methyltransferase n=1 Tax=Methanohalarchaeum thermophilum TaxID=1903181 RepID=A0A1Q6DSP4_METT1|nr:MAG: SAM-dependent methyltransferase [Candidatus Methanohalarchaeum thermophilum]